MPDWNTCCCKSDHCSKRRSCLWQSRGRHYQVYNECNYTVQHGVCPHRQTPVLRPCMWQIIRALELHLLVQCQTRLVTRIWSCKTACPWACTHGLDCCWEPSQYANAYTLQTRCNHAADAQLTLIMLQSSYLWAAVRELWVSSSRVSNVLSSWSGTARLTVALL